MKENYIIDIEDLKLSLDYQSADDFKNKEGSLLLTTNDEIHERRQMLCVIQDRELENDQAYGACEV